MAEAELEQVEEKQSEAELPEEGKGEAEEQDLTKEPGGDRPEDVYARRRARELKQTREERDRLRENNIRMEERLRALEEVKKETGKPPPREFSTEEVQALIKKGEVDPADGYAYVSALAAKKAIEAERLRQQEQIPIVQSQAEIGEYVEQIPALGNQGSDEYARVNREFINLISRGFPKDERTKAAAIRMAFGDLESLKKKAELRSMNRNGPTLPSDSSGNGGNGGNKPKDISHAPAHLQEYWQKAGLNPKEREQHFKTWQSRQAKK